MRFCDLHSTRHWVAATCTPATRQWSSCWPTWRRTDSATTSSPAGRDFIRPVTQDLYGIPRERVIGSATTLEYVSGEDGGTLNHKVKADSLDDGTEKLVRIWSRTGRRPVFAGNSNGDIPIPEFAQQLDRPSLRLLVLHDDHDREFDYVCGAEQALERAAKGHWTVVSITNNWNTVFWRCGAHHSRRTDTMTSHRWLWRATLVGMSTPFPAGHRPRSRCVVPACASSSLRSSRAHRGVGDATGRGGWGIM
jgi:hypothetical protein